MKGITLLIQLAFIAQAHGNTETTSAEEDEAMNNLIDTLVDDDKNDELVDMITSKLVDKLLGFVGTMPQAMQLRPPMAEVRQMMQTPQQLPAAPDLQVNVGFENLKPAQISNEYVPFDNSKLAKLPINLQKSSGVRTEPGWGNSKKLIQGGQTPYKSVAYPEVKSYKSGEKAKNPTTGYVKSWFKDSSAIQGKDKKLAGAIQRETYDAGSDLQKNNGFLGLSGSSQELALERADIPGSSLAEEDYDEQPDPITVLAVGICSAFVGSATTFALFHLRRSFTKTEMQAPLLN